MYKTANLTVRELKDLYPARYDKEYYSWLEGEPYSDWYEPLFDAFKEKHGAAGVDVDNIEFHVGGNYADYAGFRGRVKCSVFMKHMKLDEEYLPLCMALEEDGSEVEVHVTRRGNLEVNFRGSPWDTEPSGVFAELNPVDWAELLNAQFDDAQLEEVVKDFCEDICNDLHRELEADYEALTCEEEFIASCEANEITFEVEIGDDE